MDALEGAKLVQLFYKISKSVSTVKFIGEHSETGRARGFPLAGGSLEGQNGSLFAIGEGRLFFL